MYTSKKRVKKTTKINMSETPRTDAVAGWAIANHYGQSASSNLLADPKGIFVHAVFARELERELERENARLQMELRQVRAENVELRNKVKNQRDRIIFLEGPTNHIGGVNWNL